MSEDKIIAFIRDIADAIGTGKTEYQKAYKETLTSTPNTSKNTTTIEQRDTSGDYLLIDTAKKLGINTKGKTRKEISAAIVGKFQAKDSSNKKEETI